jgi:hypothetical protein
MKLKMKMKKGECRPTPLKIDRNSADEAEHQGAKMLFREGKKMGGTSGVGGGGRQ